MLTANLNIILLHIENFNLLFLTTREKSILFAIVRKTKKKKKLKFKSCINILYNKFSIGKYIQERN